MTATVAAMTRRLSWSCLLVAVVLTGCGGGAKQGSARNDVPVLGPRPSATQAGSSKEAADAPGVGATVTKNTSRVGGTDPVQDAAAVALAVYPSRARDLRPRVVSVTDAAEWQSAISAAQLMSRPLRAPVLLSQDGKLPAVTKAALDALEPTGAGELGGVQAVRVGAKAPKLPGAKAAGADGADPAAVAAAVDDLAARATQRRSRAVIVAGSDEPAYAMPAAGLAAKTGAPVLWTVKDRLPAATRAAIRKRKAPRIYVIGPTAAVSDTVVRQLRRLGTTKRIAGADPVANAVAVARFGDGSFGWRAVDPGHGLVFAGEDRTADASAAAALSGAGSYGPLLLVSDAGSLPKAVESYLLDIQPGYDADPVRGVYNHGWLVGDEGAISAAVQARIDGLLEIQSVR